MGQQIQNVFDAEDEKRLVNWLNKNSNLLCTPYLTEQPVFSPQKLGACEAREQLVFPSEAVDLLAKRVIFSETFRMYLVDPRSFHGSAFEWSRTVEKEPGVFVVGGGEGSRFYFRKDEDNPLNHTLTRLMRRLFSYVKSSSPLMTTNRYPRYVGCNLASRLEQGNARLIYPGGSEVELVRNPKYDAERK